MILGQARGAMIIAAAQAGVLIYEYAPKKVKMSVCGNGGASKQQVKYMVMKLLNLKDIPGKNPAIWESVSSDNGQINSNYGYLIFGENNYSQYESVRTELGENPDSRRANMIYTRPSMHIDAFQSDMNDLVCTNNVQYFIRDNKLITLVYMRSNDAIFGYNNDLAWQTYIRDKLIDDLETDTYIKYEAGPIYWNVG